MTKILITGANGFVGKPLYKLLVESGVNVIACIRNEQGNTLDGQKGTILPLGTLDENTDWSVVLDGVTVVIHLAARVHVMADNAIDPLSVYRQENVKITENLAFQAAKRGVKRFIYLSSIKVNGEQSSMPFMADDIVAPTDPYAISKWEAEQTLTRMSAKLGFELVVIRPPLVYGAGVKGNFLRLIKWVDSGLPIPLGCINNKLSMVNVDNLCDFIRLSIQHPNAIGQVFLVADADDFSTSDLIKMIAKYKHKPSHLICIPFWGLNFIAKILGKGSEVEKLCGSLQVCISKNKEMLDWYPPWSVEDGVRNASTKSTI